MNKRKYYVVRVSQFFEGRDIADGFNIDKTKNSREEAMELAKYYECNIIKTVDHNRR